MGRTGAGPGKASGFLLVGQGVLEDAFHDELGCDLLAGEEHGGEFAAEDLGSDDDIWLNEFDAAEVSSVVDGGDGACGSVELFYGEDSEGVFAVVGEHGEDGFGAMGAGFAENVEHTGVSDDHVDIFGESFVWQFPDDAGDGATASGEFAPGIDGEGCVSDDDEVVFPVHGGVLAVEDALEILADERGDDGGE
jgi:hypothetical protein